MSMPATIARNSFEGLNTGTGRAETSTGEPVRGLRAMRVLRWRILNVPKPRTSMFFCPCSASLIDSRNASTTRAQSFLEIIGPAVREIWAVTFSTRSALVIRNASGSGARQPGTLTELSDVNSYVSRVWLTCPGCIGVRPHRFHEVVEQRTRVVRTRSRFGVILHGEDWLLAVPQPFDRPVVQIDVSHGELWRPGDRILASLHRESVILGRDQHLAGRKVLDGMISAAMTVRHLHRARAVCESQDLMPQADTEYRDIPVGERADDVWRIRYRGGITRAVRQKHSIWLEGENVPGRRRRGNNRHMTVVLGEKPQNVPLDSEVVGDDV